MVYGTHNELATIVTGANLNQLITGGPHIVVNELAEQGRVKIGTLVLAVGRALHLVWMNFAMKVQAGAPQKLVGWFIHVYTLHQV